MVHHGSSIVIWINIAPRFVDQMDNVSCLGGDES